MTRRTSRSHTKSGPGRYHGTGLMIVTPDGDRIVRAPRGLRIASYGGNWKGAEYLSYREHDRVNRLCGAPERLSRAEAIERVKSERA